MATIADLKSRIDCDDLAQRLGLEKPAGQKMYRSPGHGKHSPALSIYEGGKKWHDHRDNVGGSCIDLVEYVTGCDTREAIRQLHELYNLPLEAPKDKRPPRERTKVEWLADKCLADADKAIEYVTGRGISEEVARAAIKARTLGYNDWTSSTVPAGEPMHGGPAAAFIVRSMNPGHVVAVDMRFIDPATNGGLKTMSHGDKSNAPWTSNPERLKRSRLVYLVESAVNALSVETAIPHAAAVATRGTGAVRSLDLAFLRGKQIVIAFDNDEPDERGKRPGPEAAWELYERCVAMDLAALMVDQSSWEWNDVNDALREIGPEDLALKLREWEPWIIPGLPGSGTEQFGRPRVYMPAHDFAHYWRYRVKPDFTSFIEKYKKDETGETFDYRDLAGFRIASLSKVTISSAQATMTGDPDTMPRVLFSVSVQAPRHGPLLIRRVFDDQQLHNVERWKLFGPVFAVSQFQRMVNILERGAHLGSRVASNFVGLAWCEGRLVVNEGPDCYFSDPEKQCPYHGLVFPRGAPGDARRVISAFQATMGNNAATLLLLWAVGAHLKTLLGFWPHMILQADKGSGKTTLTKRLERAVAMQIFSGQSTGTEFRLLTSISGTSHPIGWEEISARRQELIDKAVSMLQEAYQFTATRRGTDLTEYIMAAPVLLAGEDVPVKSLLGKTVRTDLVTKGPLIPEDLPRFPMRQWLEHLAKFSRAQVAEVYQQQLGYLESLRTSSEKDAGANRMVTNYAALLTAWKILTDWLDLPFDHGDMVDDLVAASNTHIAETAPDREPWTWILEIALSEIAARQFRYPYAWDVVDGQVCLCIRASHIMDHIAHTMSLRERFSALPVKSARVFAKQMRNAGVVVKDDIERTVGKDHDGNGRRVAHLMALSATAMERYGLHADTTPSA